MEQQAGVRTVVPWLQYVIDHFLTSTAFARTSHRRDLADFTFDHMVRGAVAVFGTECGDLSIARVVESTVTSEVVSTCQ